LWIFIAHNKEKKTLGGVFDGRWIGWWFWSFRDIGTESGNKGGIMKKVATLFFIILSFFFASCESPSFSETNEILTDTKNIWLYEDNKPVPADPRLGNIETIDDAFEWIENNAYANKTYKILIGYDIVHPSIRLTGQSVNNKTGVTIIIEGKDKERKIKISPPDYRLIELYRSNAIFILGNNITLIGEENCRHGVIIDGNNRFEMSTGSKITGFGIGVILVNSNSRFIMNGGAISGNKGEEILIGASYSSYNDAAGVVILNNSYFEMNEGEISENTGGKYASGVYVQGNGKFLMKGGKIINNSNSNAGGIYIEHIPGTTSSERFIMSGGLIADNTGSLAGGIYTESYITKTGGVITGYGNDLINGNKVIDNMNMPVTGKGHAIFVNSSNLSSFSYIDCFLDKTIDKNHNLDGKKPGSMGGWIE
jgi:hypothetical protein